MLARATQCLCLCSPTVLWSEILSDARWLTINLSTIFLYLSLFFSSSVSFTLFPPCPSVIASPSGLGKTGGISSGLFNTPAAWWSDFFTTSAYLWSKDLLASDLCFSLTFSGNSRLMCQKAVTASSASAPIATFRTLEHAIMVRKVRWEALLLFQKEGDNKIIFASFLLFRENER